MKGQAFVVFDEVACATSALRALQGFGFYDKPIKLVYARTKSNKIKVRDGTFYVKDVPKRPFEEDESMDSKRMRGEEQEDDPAINRILFVTNLPLNVTQDAIETLFRQYPGFKEVRTIPNKADIAFVEYTSSLHAESARRVLDGFQISYENKLTVEFAKK